MDQIIRDILCNVKEYLQGLSDSERFFALKDHTHIKRHITDFVHGNESHTEAYSTKSYVDTELNKKVNTSDSLPMSKITGLTNALNNKSKVTFSRSLSSGTKIGTIGIDGTNTDIYCEKNTTYTPASSKPLTDTSEGAVGSSAKYAREDHRHPIDNAYAKSSHTHNYSKVTFSKSFNNNNGTKIGTIDINGTNTDIYCNNVTFSRSLNNGTKIGTISINGINTDLFCEKNTDTTYAPVSATGTTPGLMTPADKNKLNRQSTYRIHLTTSKNLNVPTTSELSTIRGSQIHAMVTLDGSPVINKNIDFIINGVAYSRATDDLGYAALNISDTFPIGHYNVMAVYRDSGWAAAMDIKTLQVL